MSQGSHPWSLGLKLEDFLIAIAMVISLPESYSILRMVLMSTENRLSPDSIVAQLFIEEKSQKNPAQTALLAHRKKKKEKNKKGDKEKKKCTYCKKTGHLEKDCQKKKADENKNDKLSTSNNSEKKEGDLMAKVATMAEPSSNSESLWLFVADSLMEQSGLICKWIINSGAPSPMSCHQNWFHTYWEVSPPKKVWLGNNCYILTKGIGQLILKWTLEKEEKDLPVIWSAYYMPNVSGNLLSISYLLKQGFSVNFNNNECCIFCNKDQELCGIAKEVDGLFILKAKPMIQETTYTSLTMLKLNEDSDLNPESHRVTLISQTKKSKVTLETWHRQLGHISLNAVKQLSKHVTFLSFYFLTLLPSH